MKLSVAMIVKNEEACIVKCLNSIIEADEICIVDTGSTDDTLAVLESYTKDKPHVKVFSNEYKWADDFASARNHSIGKCSGDWILIIDADEVLQDDGIKAIRKVLIEVDGNKEIKTISFSCQAVNNKEKKHKAIRLFRRDKDVYYCGAVHNYVSIVSQMFVPITIVYGYSPAHKSDPDRAYRILKNEFNKNPKHARTLYYLGRECMSRNDYITARYMFEQCVKNSGWPAERADAYLYLARCLWNMREGDDARDMCLNAILLNPHFKEAFLFLAEISWPKQAVRWREIAETCNNEDVLFERVSAGKPNGKEVSGSIGAVELNDAEFKKISDTMFNATDKQEEIKNYINVGSNLALTRNRTLSDFCISYCDGMKWFGDIALKMGFKPYNENMPCLFMLYFDSDYERFKNHKGERYVAWVGSDVYKIREGAHRSEVLKSCPAVHVCDNEVMQSELAKYGISALIRPIFFCEDLSKYKESISHAGDRPEIYMVAHRWREAEYGVTEVEQRYNERFRYQFHIYGIQKPNVEHHIYYHGWIPEEQFDEETKWMQCLYRPNKSDGFSNTVAKAILRGHHVAYNWEQLDKAVLPMPGDGKLPDNMNNWDFMGVKQQVEIKKIFAVGAEEKI